MSGDLSIQSIQEVTAAHFHVPVDAMWQSDRRRIVARPRQIAMYLSRDFTHRTLPEIARQFGNRDHTTVMHAIKTVERLKASSVKFKATMNALSFELGTKPGGNKLKQRICAEVSAALFLEYIARQVEAARLVEEGHGDARNE